jgi:hypothetical protein
MYNFQFWDYQFFKLFWYSAFYTLRSFGTSIFQTVGDFDITFLGLEFTSFEDLRLL